MICKRKYFNQNSFFRGEAWIDGSMKRGDQFVRINGELIVKYSVIRRNVYEAIKFVKEEIDRRGLTNMVRNRHENGLKKILYMFADDVDELIRGKA